ncbi:uncharacterized protein LOC122529817 isoform X2 [Frieseomelitta varia]|uniref:uncharacterized protein LOC122529817 isoform X2 n=1 Tax=Frieseomelitta varia TaxID=561572 RepID=UPI001CB67FA1|nr:uncharacterized protein LOC122529817 isoform X2 [Frieseomelitta varia]
MDITDEDEDVVIKDSFLYEHLHKLGYIDFECVTIEKSTPKNEQKFSKLFDCIFNVRNVFKKLYSIYLEIIQDDSISNKQTEAILSAKILLNDHGCAIYSFLDKYECKPWRTMILKFIIFGTVLSFSIYTFHNTQYRNFANLSALAILYCISYMEFLRIKVHGNLKSLVSLQNDFFDLCKKGMKILKYGYKIKLHKGKSFQQFSELTAGRLKYLQPIMESLVKYLGDIACAYYHASLTLIRLLPIDTYNEDLLTRFESRSFEVHGEINYQKLKTLYHTYILTQSEMLHLLAIAYDNRIWRQSYKKIPELKLASIMEFLIRYLSTYKNKLSKHIDAYYSFKLEPMYKYRGPDSSQWQDLYMHVYLASNKLQLAYSHMLSILQDIDNDVIENLADKDCTENTMQKLSAAQKCVETAKDFIEFSSLFLIKSRINHSAIDRLEMNIPTSDADSNIRVVTDSEPEIMDEVFEEYIKEEYLKPLSEEADEISLYYQKRDKTLFKNFMAELKDALIDKKKSMSERESRALERMYKAITTKSISNDKSQRIPIPPPMPFFDAFSSIESNNKVSNDATKLQSSKLSERSDVRLIDKSMEDLEKNTNNALTEEESPTSNIIRLPRGAEFSSFLPPSFLKSGEETFIGSGENSEDDEEIKADNE